ncbi:hypothetical protein EJB05_15588, partial [Eragrostis curvula]
MQLLFFKAVDQRLASLPQARLPHPRTTGGASLVFLVVLALCSRRGDGVLEVELLSVQKGALLTKFSRMPKMTKWEAGSTVEGTLYLERLISKQILHRIMTTQPTLLESYIKARVAAVVFHSKPPCTTLKSTQIS